MKYFYVNYRKFRYNLWWHLENVIFFLFSGFRSKHITETALIKIIDDLLFNLDNDHVSGIVLVDYRKAFEMIDHILLIKKLEV